MSQEEEKPSSKYKISFKPSESSGNGGKDGNVVIEKVILEEEKKCNFQYELIPDDPNLPFPHGGGDSGKYDKRSEEEKLNKVYFLDEMHIEVPQDINKIKLYKLGKVFEVDLSNKQEKI